MLFKVRKNALFIQSKGLKQSFDIQNVDIQNLPPIEYRLESVHKAHKAGYEPLDILLCVRTPRSNKVLTVKEVPLWTFTSDTPCIHKNMDLIMFLCSCELLRSYFNYCPEVDEIMMHTEFQYVGFYNPVPECYNPTVLCTVYVDEAYEKEVEKYTKENVQWKEISSLDEKVVSKFPKRIVERILKIVKEVEPNGNDNVKKRI